MSTLAHLQQENLFLAKAKEQLEDELLSYKHLITSQKSGNSMKEVKVLKRVIKNLEVNLLLCAVDFSPDVCSYPSSLFSDVVVWSTRALLDHVRP